MTIRTKRQLDRHARRATFRPGELVVRAGDPAEAFYLIVRGRAGVAGKRLSRTLREGDYFGEIALLDGGPRSASVIALDELITIEIPRQAFLGLLARDPGFVRELAATLAARVRALEHRQPAVAAEPPPGWPMPGLS
jgi:CRP/FNR family transcriptional regulator, cyclic AMP receptor protein